MECWRGSEKLGMGKTRLGVGVGMGRGGVYCEMLMWIGGAWGATRSGRGRKDAVE